MAKRASTSKAGGGATVDASTRILVLCGAEEMTKRTRLQGLREALVAAHGETETFSFDGRTASLADVLDELRSYSLMQVYKLVVVDEADEFVKRHRDAMERYAEAPVDHATLVLRSNAWHKGNLDKLIDKVGAVIKCDALSPAEAQRELVQRAKSQHNATLSPQAAGMLIERLGTDMATLDSEVAKLALMTPGKPIEPKLIEETVGRSSDEQAWVVQDAVLESIGGKDPGDAIAKIHELVDLAGQADVLVTYFVADLVRKLNVAVLAKRAGVPEPELAKRLKLWGPRQHAFMNVVRRLDARKVGRWFDQAVEADSRSKSGLGDPVRNLECFCVRLADDAR